MRRLFRKHSFKRIQSGKYGLKGKHFRCTKCGKVVILTNVTGASDDYLIKMELNRFGCDGNKDTEKTVELQMFFS